MFAENISQISVNETNYDRMQKLRTDSFNNTNNRIMLYQTVTHLFLSKNTK